MNDFLSLLVDSSRYGQAKRGIAEKQQEIEKSRLENSAKRRDLQTIGEIFGVNGTPTPPSPVAAQSQDAVAGIFGKTAGVADENTGQPTMSAPPITPESSEAQAQIDPNEQAFSRLEGAGFGRGDAPLTIREKQNNALIGLRGAQAAKALRDNPKMLDKKISEVLPGITPEEITKQFGPSVTGDTPFSVAQRLSLLNLKQEGSNKLFPVSALPPEAQLAARAGGLGQFVSESQARILNAGNLPRQATEQEIKDSADANTIRSEISRIKDLVTKTDYKGIGLGSHFVNKLGQYSPIPAFRTDDDVVELYQLLNDVNNKMIYLQSGKQINESEFARLKSTFPDPSTNPEAFATRLQTFEKNFNNLAINRNSMARGAGRRLPGVGGPGVTNPAETGQGLRGKTSTGLGYQVIP